MDYTAPRKTAGVRPFSRNAPAKKPVECSLRMAWTAVVQPSSGPMKRGNVDGRTTCPSLLLSFLPTSQFPIYAGKRTVRLHVGWVPDLQTCWCQNTVRDGGRYIGGLVWTIPLMQEILVRDGRLFLLLAAAYKQLRPAVLGIHHPREGAPLEARDGDGKQRTRTASLSRPPATGTWVAFWVSSASFRIGGPLQRVRLLVSPVTKDTRGLVTAESRAPFARAATRQVCMY